MSLLAKILFLGICAIGSAVDEYDYSISLYDYGPELQDDNSLFYNSINVSFAEHNFYEFTEFDAGFHHYYKYPTLVVYKPEGRQELHGYYFPSGLSNLFSYGVGSSFYMDYEPIRKYFLGGNKAAFTPKAAFYAYPYFYEFKLNKLVYGNAIPTKLAVMFVTPPGDMTGDFIEVARFRYNEKIIELSYLYKPSEEVDI